MSNQSPGILLAAFILFLAGSSRRSPQIRARAVPAPVTVPPGAVARIRTPSQARLSGSAPVQAGALRSLSVSTISKIAMRGVDRGVGADGVGARGPWARGTRYQSGVRIDGVRVTPTKIPSGLMKRLTV